MITKVFSVYDSKALAYGVPFFMPTVGGAVRAFSDLSRDRNSIVSRHGSDFVLYLIGSFDDNSGVLTSVLPFVNLGTGGDFGESDKVRCEPVVPIEPIGDFIGGNK